MPSFLYSEEEAGIANLESIQEALFAPVSIREDRSKSGLNISIFLFHQSRLFYFYFTYICIYWMGRVTTVYIEVRGQFESWLSPFNLGFPGLKVQSSGLVATVFALWTIFLVLNQDSWLQVEGKKGGGGTKRKKEKGKKKQLCHWTGLKCGCQGYHVLLTLWSLCHFLQRAMGRKAVMGRSGTSRRSICFSAKTLQQQSFTQSPWPGNWNSLLQSWVLCILPWENIGEVSTKEYPEDEEEVGTRQKQQIPDVQWSLSHRHFAERITDNLRTQTCQEMDARQEIGSIFEPCRKQ